MGEPFYPYFKLIAGHREEVNRRLKKLGQGKEDNYTVSDDIHPRSPLRRVMDQFNITIQVQNNHLVLVEPE